MKPIIVFYKKYKVLNRFFIIQALLLILIFFSLLISEESITAILYFVIIILCGISCYSLYQVYKNVADHLTLEAEVILYEKQKQIQKEHLNATKEGQKLMNEFKDEVYTMLDKENMVAQNEEEAKIKATQIIKKYSDLYFIDYCQNKIIDSIIYNKFMWAKSLGIKTTAQIIVPETIEVSDIDIMFLFTNLLDNAIEACEKVKAENRFIDVEVMIKANYLTVRVSNSKDSISLDTKAMMTTKNDTDNHGLGIPILRKVCKKNKGSLKIVDSGDTIDIYATVAFLVA